MKKIVLAYSGGLDTSIILKWLQENYKAEVIAYTADIGQEMDKKKIIRNAKKLGVKKIIIKNLKNIFVKDYVFPMIRGHAIYEGVYLLGTSIARPLIAKDQIQVAKKFKAFAVPGSEKVATEAKQEGIDQIFKDSGFQWREPGCSMCLAMNSDKLIGNQISASSSNRNFKGRQGSPSGRTLLMSPAMVAAAAINGKVSDVREFIK